MKTFLRCFVGLALVVSAGVRAGYVTVGNPGNSGEPSGAGAGGIGTDAIVGGVAYEYQINEFEVTAGEYVAFLNAVDPSGANPNNIYNSSMISDSYGCQITWNAGAAKYDFSGRPSGDASNWTNRPVNYVSWYDAARYTNWLTNGMPAAGGTETGVYTLTGPTTVSSIMDHQPAAVTYGTAYFIPTEDEWYKAAYYDPADYNGTGSPGYYDYPTGSDTVPGYVNDGGNLSGGGSFVEGGSDPGGYATYDSDEGTKGIGEDHYRTNVGEWENSASPYGTFDQGGNIFEWNEALIGVSSRGLRGGSFYYFTDLQAASRDSDDPSNEYSDVGFRVAAIGVTIPEPTSLVLLAAAGLGMFGRRKRGAC